jgi:hypothetical protein
MANDGLAFIAGKSRWIVDVGSLANGGLAPSQGRVDGSMLFPFRSVHGLYHGAEPLLLGSRHIIMAAPKRSIVPSLRPGQPAVRQRSNVNDPSTLSCDQANPPFANDPSTLSCDQANPPFANDPSSLPCDQASPPFAIDPTSTIHRLFPATRPARRSPARRSPFF